MGGGEKTKAVKGKKSKGPKRNDVGIEPTISVECQTDVNALMEIGGGHGNDLHEMDIEFPTEPIPIDYDPADRLTRGMEMVDAMLSKGPRHDERPTASFVQISPNDATNETSGMIASMHETLICCMFDQKMPYEYIMRGAPGKNRDPWLKNVFTNIDLRQLFKDIEKSDNPADHEWLANTKPFFILPKELEEPAPKKRKHAVRPADLKIDPIQVNVPETTTPPPPNTPEVVVIDDDDE